MPIILEVGWGGKQEWRHPRELVGWLVLSEHLWTTKRGCLKQGGRRGPVLKVVFWPTYVCLCSCSCTHAHTWTYTKILKNPKSVRKPGLQNNTLSQESKSNKQKAYDKDNRKQRERKREKRGDKGFGKKWQLRLPNERGDGRRERVIWWLIKNPGSWSPSIDKLKQNPQERDSRILF